MNDGNLFSDQSWWTNGPCWDVVFWYSDLASAHAARNHFRSALARSSIDEGDSGDGRALVATALIEFPIALRFFCGRPTHRHREKAYFFLAIYPKMTRKACGHAFQAFRDGWISASSIRFCTALLEVCTLLNASCPFDLAEIRDEAWGIGTKETDFGNGNVATYRALAEAAGWEITGGDDFYALVPVGSPPIHR